MLIAFGAVLVLTVFLGQFFTLGDGGVKQSAMTILTLIWLGLILTAVIRAGWKGGVAVFVASLVLGVILRPMAAFAVHRVIQVSRRG